MRLLLDTHALMWWLLDDPKLTRAAEDAIASEDAEVFVSAVSAFEIVSKFRRGKLPDVTFLATQMEEVLAAESFAPLSLSMAHAKLAASLQFDHRDPFDRLLIAQAMIEDMTLVSNQRLFDETGVRRVW